MTIKMETIIFGGGCFWCTEAVFRELQGVVSVIPGYAGGTVEDPTYTQVSSGTTGHAEVIKIEFKPSDIGIRDLLTVFFATHDPTTQNRQGNDQGPQYRSIILYTTDSQKQEAEKLIKEVNDSLRGTQVVTELKPLEKFYPAENYHMEYYQKNPETAYCELVIEPKIKLVRNRFKELIQSSKDSIGNPSATCTKKDKELSPELRHVARKKGTEAPFSGKYWNLHEQGMYQCAICGTELFSSDTKFDSGTGWPSFSNPTNLKNITLRKDDTDGMTRTEVRCKKCGAHLGHVFDDGPKYQGGKRYCINSICLKFKKEK